MTIRGLLLGCAALAWTGCTVIVNGRIDDNDPYVDCADAEDGESCGPGAVCLENACNVSRCGDGYVDSLIGEECEDGNQTSGDGCEPGGCRYTCADAANCDDGDPCNGEEECSADHVCGAGTPPVNGTMACIRDDESTGTCVDELCAPEGCGDEVLAGDEECDEDSPGCRSDCTWVCETDEECDDGSVCTGTETCNTTDHVCVPGTPLSCDDDEVCTDDQCDPEMGCTYALIDADEDGVSPLTCDHEGDTLHEIVIYGDDCDDDDDQISPQRPEQCDTVDHDCDGNQMNDVTYQDYYPDADGDGYPSMLSPMSLCAATTGYILPRVDGKWDCADSQPERHPRSSSAWFDHPTCTISGSATFSCSPVCFYRCPVVSGQDNQVTEDWNCDGSEDERYTLENSDGCTYTTFLGAPICFGSGWTGSKPILGCGWSAEYRTCSVFRTSCLSSIGNKTQECH